MICGMGDIINEKVGKKLQGLRWLRGIIVLKIPEFRGGKA